MECHDQDAILESVVQQVERSLRKIVDGRTNDAKFNVPIPYGSTEESKLLIADWLVTNFQQCVKCLCEHQKAFVRLSRNNLLPANIYFVNLDGYPSPRRSVP